MDSQTLDSELLQQNQSKRRRDLLPWWIKTFLWIFLVLSVLVPFNVIGAMWGFQYQISLYGLSANGPFSIDGSFLLGLFVLKGITAIGLWTEKDWAIISGQIDAILGIIICLFMMFVHPFINSTSGAHFEIRLELVLLIPFLLKLINIQDEWKSLTVNNAI